jgi:hypothetical protein
MIVYINGSKACGVIFPSNPNCFKKALTLPSTSRLAIIKYIIS